MHGERPLRLGGTGAVTRGFEAHAAEPEIGYGHHMLPSLRAVALLSCITSCLCLLFVKYMFANVICVFMKFALIHYQTRIIRYA